MLKLYAFTCGWLQTSLGFFIEGDHKEMVRSPVPAYLIDHPDGLALFDTGFGLRFRKEIGARLAPGEEGVEFDESADIAMRLRAIDIDPATVRWIINSHFHSDHCGGNASIPNATVIIQSKELAWSTAHEDGMLYSPADYDHGHPVRAIDGDLDLFGDGSVLIFPTVGHTPGHQSVRVRLPSGDVVLSADCCYLRRSLDEMIMPPHSFDKAAGLQTLAMLRDMRERGTRIFFGHDAAFWRSVPQGVSIT